MAAGRDNEDIRVTARVDYAVRAAVELAAAPDPARPLKAEAIARAQGIPHRFLDHILASLRQGGVVESRRGAEGGHRLARPAREISLADVIRAVDGPLASVAGTRPDALSFDGSAAPLATVWVAVRANLRAVLEATSLADVAADELPAAVRALADAPDAWEVR